MCTLSVETRLGLVILKSIDDCVKVLKIIKFLKVMKKERIEGFLGGVFIVAGY